MILPTAYLPTPQKKRMAPERAGRRGVCLVSIPSMYIYGVGNKEGRKGSGARKPFQRVTHAGSSYPPRGAFRKVGSLRTRRTLAEGAE